MPPPECFGNGIYQYWRKSKEAIKLLINGIKEKDPLSIFFGTLFTGAVSIKPAINIYEGNYNDVLLPKPECSQCDYLAGCFGAGVSCITNELGVEFGEYLQDLRDLTDNRKLLPE